MMDSATENDVDAANVTFVVDKTKIKESSLVEKCPQLADLGLTVYSQDVFEEAVLDQIDEACKNLSEVRDSRLDGEFEAKNDKSSGNSFSTSQFENATVSSVNKSLLFDESNDLIRLGEATPFEVFAKSEFRCKNGRTQDKSVTVFSEDEEIVKSDVCQEDCRSGSDEEYKPSSSDEVEEMNTDGDVECDEPLPKKQKLESKTSKKKVKKTTKLAVAVKTIKKCQDDGSDKHFEIRLKAHKKVKLRKASDRLERTGSLDEPDDDIQLKGGLLIPAELWKKLFKYQRTGVRWLWELHRQSVGGIMGDEMGLGKTIQLIAFLGSLSRSKLHNDGFGFSGLGATLIVCPTTVMHQWVKEMHNWWPEFRVAILHDSGSYGGPRHRLISKIHSVSGVLITSYSTLTNERQTLVKYDWHYVILDEGHKIRNPDAQVTLAVKQFRTPHRLILTGTPMQNSLKELWSIFDFVFPGRLGALPDFIREFGIPITQGGYANASPVQVETAYKCACVLREAISPYLLRRTKADVKTTVNLPSKSEQVLFCRLTEHQRNVYKQYLTSRECDAILKGRLEPFVGLISLRKLCNHPDLVTGGPNRLGDLDESRDPSVTYGYWPRSGKMVVLEALLKLWKEQNHRVLLFSQSRQMLNIMEKFVKSEKYSYLRMDGSTAIGSRQGLVARFNEDSSLFCLLLTTRVGGLGLNLIGADRIIIYDPDWNPSTDIQARERAWRIGQTRPVTVYRLLLAGTIEEKIYHRQIFKQFLTNRILKDPKQRRFFKTNDLFELFTLSDDRNAKGTETSVLFAGTGSEIQISTSLKSAKNIEKHKSKNIFDEIANEKDKIYSNPPNTVEDEEDIDFVPKVIVSADTESTCDKISVEPSSSDVVEEKNSKSQRLRELAKKLSQQLANCKEEQESSVKKRSKRKRKKCKLDGVVIPNLAKTTDYKPGLKDDDSRTSEELSQKQDDYVLNRLFKKSNIHSALKHDKVVDSGEADSTLVQAEADSVARRAVKSLVDSRRRCHSAYSGIPTWTGKHGSLAPRFGNVSSFRRKASFSATKKKAKKSTPNKTQSLFGGSDLLATTNVATCDQPLHSNDLLSLIKNKNQFRRRSNADSDDEEERHSSDVVVPPPVVSKSKSLPAVENTGSRYDGILAELRNFIAFGAKVDGRAETEEILTRFGSRVALQDSAVFKSLLQKICDFNRTVNGNGVWVLKTQFR